MSQSLLAPPQSQTDAENAVSCAQDGQRERDGGGFLADLPTNVQLPPIGPGPGGRTAARPVLGKRPHAQVQIPNIASEASVAQAAFNVLTAPVIQAIREAATFAAASAGAPCPLEIALVQLVRQLAQHWEVNYTSNDDVEAMLEDVRGATAQAGGADARHSPALPLFPHTSSAAVSVVSPEQRVRDERTWERDGFWSNWAEWSKITWTLEAEAAVRAGIRRDVVDEVKHDKKEHEDLEAMLALLADALRLWRGKTPSAEEAREVTEKYVRRFWYRRLAHNVAPGIRGVAISAAASVLEGSGLTAEQREAKAAAARAVLAMQGVAHVAADNAASQGLGLQVPGGRGGGRGSGPGGRFGGRGQQPFRGLCHVCKQRGHRYSDCPNVKAPAGGAKDLQVKGKKQ
jgi:hypothetical protein